MHLSAENSTTKEIFPPSCRGNSQVIASAREVKIAELHSSRLMVLAEMKRLARLCLS
jgi:hypothetical protein